MLQYLMLIHDGLNKFLHKCSIRSIVCLNLPSFSGGLNPWGTPSERKQRKVSSIHNADAIHCTTKDCGSINFLYLKIF